jgi:hypothetical protein
MLQQTDQYHTTRDVQFRQVISVNSGKEIALMQMPACVTKSPHEAKVGHSHSAVCVCVCACVCIRAVLRHGFLRRCGLDLVTVRRKARYALSVCISMYVRV